MPVVACPKCKTKFKLSSEMLGKAIRCTSCKAAFRTPAAAPAKPADGAKTSAKPAAKPKSKATAKSASVKNASSTPVKKKRTLEDELFSSAPRPGAPDPLGNFVLEDPGFSTLELPDPEGEDDSDGDLFSDKQHLMENPALKGRPTAANPYAAPGSSGSRGGSKKSAKALRRRYLKHEGEVRSLGLLYMFFGLIGVLSAVAIVIMAIVGSQSIEALPMEGTLLVSLFAGLVLFFSALQFALGWFLNELQSWAKIVLTILLVIGLLGFPIGTAINAYFLWVLHSEKGRAIFTDDYREAVRLTPNIKPESGVILTIFGILIGLAIGYFGVNWLFFN